MTFIIRPARFPDAPALANLLLEVGGFSAIINHTPLEVTSQIESQLAECLADESHSVYISVDETDLLVGYISVHWLAYLFMPGPEGFISELFLLPIARGKGLGSMLMDAVKTEAVQRGAYRLSLLNGKNQESYERGFYPKQGWEERPDMANFIYLIPDE
ncbi:MAG: GNAT family N-acetyltransferase [Chloroflexi bacterium]|nr:GNAT family N-acetyltransferase [Chloroflexota bacterium]